MSSSPIEYTSFMKILLCCNIPALSASSLQKKERNKVMCEIQNINEKTMKGRRKQLLDINKHRDKNIYIVSVFNCMEYIIVDCMLELDIHHFSLQLKTIILKMNNSGTCLIRHTKGPEKCVGLYRVSENCIQCT
jgi:hypothetical protein